MNVTGRTGKGLKARVSWKLLSKEQDQGVPKVMLAVYAQPPDKPKIKTARCARTKTVEHCVLAEESI